MSMAHSIESRTPFLDHHLTSLVFSIDPKLRYEDRITKSLLKKIMKPHLNEEILNRKKKGFSNPIGHFFRNELKEYITDASFFNGLNKFGFKKNKVKEIVDQHLNGKVDNRKKLWTLFVLVEWSKNNK